MIMFFIDCGKKSAQGSRQMVVQKKKQTSMKGFCASSRRSLLQNSPPLAFLRLGALHFRFLRCKLCQVQKKADFR